MNDQQLLRYSRQILLPQIDIAGQERLLRARVLIVGMGGLGCPVAMYLAAAGVGQLVLADFDSVDLSNLQRQIAHDHHRIGMNKAESAAQTLRALNPEVQITCITQRLEGDSLQTQVQAADLVLDCTDNFATRHAINRACVAARVPLVSGAAIAFEGQVAVFDSRQPHSPCYRCLYDEQADSAMRCADSGVIAPLVGVIGSLQALEAVKLLAGAGASLTGRLLLLDALTLQWQSLQLPRDPGCPVCASTVACG
jgi:adenylyltransferase/sulfurtransferase